MSNTIGRPRKKGLDYFPVDVDIWQDIKIRRIMHKHGPASFTVLMYILSYIYREYYYIKWDADMSFLAGYDLNIDEEFVTNVILEAASIGIFDANLFTQYHILTSAGIQDRYFHAIAKRICVIDNPAYLLVNIDDYFEEVEYEIINNNHALSGAESPGINGQPEYPERKGEYPERKVGESDEETQVSGEETHHSIAKHSVAYHNHSKGIPDSAPKKTKKEVEDKWLETEFKRIWEVWPRKVARPTALAAFKKVHKNTKGGMTEELIEKIIKAIVDQNEALWKGQDQRYTPHLSSWLNGERWNDEIPQTRGNGQTKVPDRNRIRADHEYDDPTDVRHSPYFQEFIKKQEAERQAAKEAKA